MRVKHLLIVSLAALSAAVVLTSSTAGAEEDYPSPAATRAWVRVYVATNTANSVSVSNAAARVSADAARGMSAVMEILRADTSTNAVRLSADAFVSEIAPSVGVLVDSMIGI